MHANVNIYYYNNEIFSNTALAVRKEPNTGYFLISHRHKPMKNSLFGVLK